VGSMQIFTIAVTNIGTTNLTSVNVMDAVPSSLMLIDAVPSLPDWTCDTLDQLVSCSGDLAINETATIMVTYKAIAPNTVEGSITDGYIFQFIYDEYTLFGSTNPQEVELRYNNGTVVMLTVASGKVGGNTIEYNEPPVNYEIHVSCSDTFFEDNGPGFGDKGGPHSENDPAAGYYIEKHKDGILDKTCGCLVRDLVVDNTATVSFPGEPPLDSNEASVTIEADLNLCEPCKASKK